MASPRTQLTEREKPERESSKRNALRSVAECRADFEGLDDPIAILARCMMNGEKVEAQLLAAQDLVGQLREKKQMEIRREQWMMDLGHNKHDIVLKDIARLLDDCRETI